MFYKEIQEQPRPRSVFLEHPGDGGTRFKNFGKGEGELQDVTSLPKTTLDMSLMIAIFQQMN